MLDQIKAAAEKKRARLRDAEAYNVAVVGAGYIGTVIASVLAESGCAVHAIEKNPHIVALLNRGSSPVKEPGLEELVAEVVSSGRLAASADYANVADADVILITVGTPLGEDGSADTAHIGAAVEAIAPYVRDGQLVMVKSTVPPFTTQKLVADRLRPLADLHVAFCPERLAEGNAIAEFRSLPIVVGGVDRDSTRHAEEFWRSVLDVEVFTLESATAAELVKLADNAWIDLNIALAFELAKLADQVGVDVLPIIAAANSLPKGQHHVNILLPSVGVGGYCLTKDPWFLHAFAKAHGTSFETARVSRTVNDQSPRYAAGRIDEALRRAFPEKSPGEMRITVMGVAFKNNTGDCRFTPTKGTIEALKEFGYELVVYDPWVSDRDMAGITDARRASDPAEALTGAHGVAFLAGHRELKAITPDGLAGLVEPGAVVFDGRMFFDRDTIEAFGRLGLVVRGVGR